MNRKLLLVILISVFGLQMINAETVSTNGKKKTLIEDFRGDWCGYCPRSIAAERHLANKYGDDVVIVNYMYGQSSGSIHLPNDVFNAWTESIRPVSGFPSTFFDRGTENMANRHPVISNWEPVFKYIEENRESDALDFRFSATIGVNNEILFNAEFGQDAVQANKYRITFLAQVDDLRVSQANYYSNTKFEGEEVLPEMEPFIKGSSYVNTEIDKVVIANSDFNGLPVETANMEYILTLPSLEGISFNNYIATAIVTDNDGNYVNALSTQVTSKEKGIESITILNKEQTSSCYVGQVKHFDIVVYPEEYPEDETLVWTSSNEDVVIVDSSTGECQFVAPGYASITVSSSKNPDICDSIYIRSEYPFIGRVIFEEPKNDIEVGSTYQLEYTILGIEGWENYDHLVWSSSDEQIATVNDNGVVTAISEGTVVINAVSFIDNINTRGWSITLTIKPSLTSVSTPIRKLYRDTRNIIPLQLKNTYGILGMQCDITLSEGASFVTDESGRCNITLDKNRTPRHSVAYNMQDDRHLRLIVNSANNTVIEPGEGEFLYIPVEITKEAPENFNFSVTNVSLSDTNSNSVTINDYVGEYPVEDLVKGDLNGDNKIDVADVTATISVIMNTVSSNITPEAGDFNGDGTTDISDIVALIDHILSFPASSVKKAPAEADEADDEQPELAWIFATDNTYECGKDAEIKVRLTNLPPVVAAQFDIELPENFEFVENDSDLAINLVGEVADTHQLTASRIGDNAARILIYSLSNSAFKVTDDFLSLAIRVNENASEKENILFSNIKLVSENRDEMTADSAVMRVMETTHAYVTETVLSENITVDGNNIVVSNLNEDYPVTLHSVSGVLIDRATPCNGTVRFNAPKGLYLIETANKTYRIAIR